MRVKNFLLTDLGFWVQFFLLYSTKILWHTDMMDKWQQSPFHYFGKKLFLHVLHLGFLKTALPFVFFLPVYFSFFISSIISLFLQFILPFFQHSFLSDLISTFFQLFSLIFFCNFFLSSFFLKSVHYFLFLNGTIACQHSHSMTTAGGSSSSVRVGSCCTNLTIFACFHHQCLHFYFYHLSTSPQ